MTDLADRLAGLSPAKLKLLARRLAGTTPLPPGPVPRRAARGPLPLSSAQQRLWFLERSGLGGAVLTIPAAVRLRGRLDEAALRRALGEIVGRHEVLRTRFAEVAGMPVQSVAPHRPLPLPRASLMALPPAARPGELRRLAGAEAARPFDLGRGPLLRAVLLALGPEEHVLLLTLHHVVADAWSLGLFMGELAALYAAFAGGAPSPLPEPPLQYGDFALWQREWLAGPAAAEQLAWWRRRLAGAPPELRLPADRPRPAGLARRGRRQPLAVPPPLCQAVARLGAEQGATTFMVLAAAFAVLLGRYSGEDDLLVGTPIANRNRPEVEGLMGLLANTLPLRLDLAGDPTWGELVARVQAVALGAFAHQELPFDRLVEELRPERRLAVHPLFQVVLVFQNAPFEPPALPGLALGLAESYGGAAQYDLTLDLFARGGALAGWLEFDAGLFDPATVARLGAHFLALLADAAAHPGRRVAEAGLLGPAERQLLLREWNGAAPAVEAPPACLHELFAAQARRTPEAVAVVCGEERLSYRELAARARLLAGRLAAAGVGPEARVALLLERSAALVVAVLGVLEAGAAYLPLDPALPPQRLALLLADAGARVAVTSPELRQLLPEAPALRLCLLAPDGTAADAAPEPKAPPAAAPARVQAQNLAYVIYTSGSTGAPKGVLVTHANVVRLVSATASLFDFGAADVWSLLHSYAFDFSVWELWGALLHGGRLVVVPLDIARRPAALAALLLREGVTVLNQTPSAFQLLAPELAGAAPRRLPRWIIFGGEALAPASLCSWFEHCGQDGPRLVNMYGITETTVHVTWRPLGPADCRRAGDTASVLGRALPDLELYLLDRGLEPVPIGVAGEIAVGGAGLARGYLARPELTAERFVPDPWSGRPGARLYRSGDLGRYLADSDLAYLGRLDQQVKVRGFRVEPGEIEAALGRCAGVRQAAVVATEAAPGDRRLVAYVAPEPGAALSVAELRGALRAELPDYMVPAGPVILAALPLTAHGKIDRAALPALAAAGDGGGGATGGEGSGRAPAGPVEELLAALWEELLGTGRVTADDDFFALGGHSLLAARLVARIAQSCGVELALRAVFDAPTLARLAGAVEAARRADAGAAAPPLRPVPRDGELPLSFAQERLWVLDRLAPGSPAYNVPALLALGGALDRGALAAALAALVRRHEALRTTFALRGDRPVQVVAAAAAAPGALPVIDLAALPPARAAREARRWAAAEARRAFDLARGPLLRPTLVRETPDRHRLLLDLHHIVVDGWSLGILARELQRLYAAARGGTEAVLPALPVQYADYAVWQRAALSGGRLAALLAYWRGRLAPGPTPLAPLDLPADRPRPAVQSFRGGRRQRALAADLSPALGRLARRQGATAFMTLLAAFFALLHRLTGEARIAVGSPVANRPRPELEGVVGLFLNTLVLDADLGDDPAFAALLDRVRETALGAYAHQEMPFERLVAELRPERDLARAPLVSVLFTLDQTPAPPAAAAGLTWEPLAVESEAAKFDLALVARQDGDGLLAGWSYSADLLDASSVERLARHFERLLASALAAPQLAVSRLDLLDPGERHQLLVEWNATARQPETACVTQMFEAQVARTPGAPALTLAGMAGEDGERLSYAELNRRANRLARRLGAAGVGPEVRVGICLPRGVAMVTAVLGVLKAGGAYVPVDPADPPARRRWLLADAGVSVLLAAPEPAAEDAPDGADALDPPPRATAENLAYVVYTSGSTGQPKGVAMRHAALANLIAWQVGEPRLRAGGRRLGFAALGFDASFRELFSALCSGGELVLVSEELRRDLAALSRRVVASGVEQLLMPAVVLERFAEELRARGPGAGSLREVLTAGEQVRATATLRETFAARPDCRLHNQYGPSETHMVTSYSLAGPPAAWPALPPIGRPIANVSVHLLDRLGQPVPIGVAGELHVGGAPLARGYFGRPDLTAAAFVPDPFGAVPGGRLYRTGDLARRLPDGNLEFLGRLDHQVKVRGVRVEPGEIEAALAQHPAVARAAVVARADGGAAQGSQRPLRLVAYVVGAGLERPTAGELRAFLAARLPEPLVPADWVFLPALPLTPNGKLDRPRCRRPRRRRTPPPRRSPRAPPPKRWWRRPGGRSSG